MVGKYGTGHDSGCYTNSTTLINKLNIQNEHDLEVAEQEITALCSEQIEFSPPPYTLAYLNTIHRQLFQDLYPWAGSLRSVDISKGNTRFCSVNRIEAEAQNLFKKLHNCDYFEKLMRSELIKKVSELYGDLNMVHPYREGNGRTQRILFEHLITNAGFEISWKSVTEKEWLAANIAAVYCDYQAFEIIFDKCIGKPI